MRSELVEIGTTKLPVLGLGTWQVTGSECQRVVETAIELGYRHVDTAAMYENEADVGRALANAKLPREKLWLTTKVSPDDLGRDDVQRSLETSLKKLGTEYVDLALVHWPNPSIPLEETLGEFRSAREQGIVRNIGVSNFPSKQLRRAVELADIFCNQVEYHPYLAQQKILEVAAEHDMLVTAYSPLARGRVTKDETLAAIGRAHGKSPTQVVLRWLTMQRHVAAVPKASSKEHLAQNLDIFDFQLSDSEMKQVHGLAQGMRVIDPSFAPDWDD